eukprot:TRINITY_DN2078_c0_g2_i2.p1 TRINITY_DN2078_c0_g2~~TRINITY_DN2078_c0_g2_i2.p1  ORF type:complete len:291 (-),score=45.34 TRINITY_DN2078_c0_g2_i2:36-845(-)
MVVVPDLKTLAFGTICTWQQEQLVLPETLQDAGAKTTARALRGTKETSAACVLQFLLVYALPLAVTTALLMGFFATFSAGTLPSRFMNCKNVASLPECVCTAFSGESWCYAVRGFDFATYILLGLIFACVCDHSRLWLRCIAFGVGFAVPLAVYYTGVSGMAGLPGGVRGTMQCVELLLYPLLGLLLRGWRGFLTTLPIAVCCVFVTALVAVLMIVLPLLAQFLPSTVFTMLMPVVFSLFDYALWKCFMWINRRTLERWPRTATVGNLL